MRNSLWPFFRKSSARCFNICFFVVSFVIAKAPKKVAKLYDASTNKIIVLLPYSQKAVLISVGAIMAIDKLGYDVSAMVAGLGLTGFTLV
ncbi:MAG: small conductance mechanosensitive channel [Lentisphaeria bacterium]